MASNSSLRYEINQKALRERNETYFHCVRIKRWSFYRDFKGWLPTDWERREAKWYAPNLSEYFPLD